MSGRVEDKVAVVTGAARGQGRSHAVRLAQQGRRHVTGVTLPVDAGLLTE
jgi:NAD(P)-dependent dehydrogenase (short-subunit alcohol dehydrogenase family)